MPYSSIDLSLYSLSSGLYIHAAAPIATLEKELSCEFYSMRNHQTQRVHPAAEAYVYKSGLRVYG